MRRIGDLMRDIGFNPEAPESTQRAFYRHLARVADGTSPGNPSGAPEQKPSEAQLSFDPDILGTNPCEPKKKAAITGG